MRICHLQKSAYRLAITLSQPGSLELDQIQTSQVREGGWGIYLENLYGLDASKGPTMRFSIAQRPVNYSAIDVAPDNLLNFGNQDCGKSTGLAIIFRAVFTPSVVEAPVLVFDSPKPGCPIKGLSIAPIVFIFLLLRFTELEQDWYANCFDLLQVKLLKLQLMS